MPAKASWEAKAVFDAPQITLGPTRLEVKRLTVMLVTFSLLGLGVASAIADTHVELHASLSGAKSFPHAQFQTNALPGDSKKIFHGPGEWNVSKNDILNMRSRAVSSLSVVIPNGVRDLPKRGRAR